MRIADYIFKRLKEEGVEYTFGIPGDFILPLYAAQERCGMKTVVMTNEPSAGYAADVYARLKGLGVAIVTQGVGALSMVNPIALAYAEKSPVIVLTGAPEIAGRDPDALFHHRVKRYESQHKIYQEVTASTAVLNDELSAISEIDRVIDTTKKLSRPGYIEIPRDMVNVDAPPRCVTKREKTGNKDPVLKEALGEIINRLNTSRRPVIYAGVEIERFGLMKDLARLAEKLNMPVATTLLGKSVLPESHPNFIGNYIGKLSPKHVRDYVEGSDCILSLGSLPIDFGVADVFASYTPHIIQATSEQVCVSHHCYKDVNLQDVMKGLLKTKTLKRRSFKPPRKETVRKKKARAAKKLTVATIIDELNNFLTNKHLVISDVGDPLFASVELKTDIFIGPAYYASMGFATPGAIGAQLALPSRRPVVLVGDGCFQMTGVELSTAKKMGLNPIVIVFDNSSFATLKVLDKERDYLHVHPWDYVGLARSLGGNGTQVSTSTDFTKALRTATNSKDFYLIDAIIDEDDISPTLGRLAKDFRPRIQSLMK
ncbi:MAG: thiamine pyrophosphate-binding protein [Candidatus Brocadiales bacterium]|nr:thiamine pyrophosphate-binding protein [Candidatus Bathyanammoxibius amoris]